MSLAAVESSFAAAAVLYLYPRVCLLALLLPPEPASATAGSFNSTNINISSSVAVPAFFLVLSLRRPRSVGRSVTASRERSCFFLYQSSSGRAAAGRPSGIHICKTSLLARCCLLQERQRQRQRRCDRMEGGEKVAASVLFSELVWPAGRPSRGRRPSSLSLAR